MVVQDVLRHHRLDFQPGEIPVHRRRIRIVESDRRRTDEDDLAAQIRRADTTAEHIHRREAGIARRRTVEAQERVASLVHGNVVRSHLDRQSVRAGFNPPQSDAERAHGGGQGETGVDNAIMFNQQGQPPQYAVVIEATVDEPADAGLRGDGIDAVEDTGCALERQQVETTVKANPRSRRTVRTRDMVEIEISRADDIGTCHFPPEIAVVVEQARGHAVECDIDAEIALEGLLDVGQRCAVRLGEHNVHRNRRRMPGGDSLDQLRYAIARPWPLADGSQTDVIDVDHYRVGCGCTRGGPHQQGVQHEPVHARDRWELEQSTEPDRHGNRQPSQQEDHGQAPWHAGVRGDGHHGKPASEDDDFGAPVSRFGNTAWRGHQRNLVAEVLHVHGHVRIDFLQHPGDRPGTLRRQRQVVGSGSG